MDLVRTITYGPLPAHILDLHVPTAAPQSAPAPLVVFVHGGAWRSEDKAQHAQLAARIALHTGCPVAVPNYRLTPRDPLPESALHHPAHALDVLLALSFLLSWADSPVPFDVTRLFLVGHSCGAHILACIFLDSSDATPTLTPSPEVLAAARGIVLSEGIFDIDLLLARFPAYRAWFVANAFGERPSYTPFDATSYPLRAGGEHIHWLVLHSRGDSLVDVGQAEKLYEHLRALTCEARNSLYDILVQKDWTTLASEHNAMLHTAQYSDLVGGFISSLLFH